MYQTHFPTATFKKETKIFDETLLSNIGVLYWQQSTLEQIAELSGPLAVANEFQIHYWALVVRMKFVDNSVVDIALPTTIFNYAQEVNPSHIDFELKDVSAVSDALLPIHNMITNQLLPKLQETFVDSEHYTIEYLSVPLNTMHRHPNGVASFSGTDLRKDHEKDTGIVFPLKTGKDTPSFSSIIYNNPVKLIHTEYRTANGNVDDEKGIQYTKGRCATFIKSSISIPSKAEQFFGHKPTNNSYLVDKTGIADIHPLLEILNEIKYTPNTQFIKAENLTKKVYTLPTKPTTLFKEETKTTKEEITLVYDKDIKNLVKQIADVTLKDYTYLETMNIPQLRLQLLPLEQYYYQDTDNISLSDYVTLTKIELLEQIIEVQNLIVAEIDDTLTSDIEEPKDIKPSIEYMRKMLISFGAPKEDIDKAPDQQVENWYIELTLYDEVY